MIDKTPKEKSIELDGYDMDDLLRPTPMLDSIIKRDLENEKLKNLSEGEAGTGYALLSDVLAEDLKCCGNCKCYDVIDDKGSVCIQDAENGWTEMPVEHTAICDDWIYDDLIKKSRVK